MQLPADRHWYAYLAHSLNVAADPTITGVRPPPTGYTPGDICTLGIFCLSDDNRDLAETNANDVAIGHVGGGQIAYTDETPAVSRLETDFQCQAGGPASAPTWKS